MSDQVTDFSPQINEMLAMQNALNEMTNGDNWRSGITQLGKVIDWRRCIYMETAELIDSYPWKHWKSVTANTDIENVRVELVDIWHFLLSLAMEHFSPQQAALILNRGLNASQKHAAEPQMTLADQLSIHEDLMAKALQRQPMTEMLLEDLAKAFFNSCQTVELDFKAMYRIYMAKNVLNKFRQDHGYKEGVYIKDWNGKEDNVVMFELIERLEEFSGEKLYQGLKQAYNQMVG